jgi:hypothetical protein
MPRQFIALGSIQSQVIKYQISNSTFVLWNLHGVWIARGEKVDGSGS